MNLVKEKCSHYIYIYLCVCDEICASLRRWSTPSSSLVSPAVSSSWRSRRVSPISVRWESLISSHVIIKKRVIHLAVVMEFVCCISIAVRCGVDFHCRHYCKNRWVYIHFILWTHCICFAAVQSCLSLDFAIIE